MISRVSSLLGRREDIVSVSSVLVFFDGGSLGKCIVTRAAGPSLQNQKWGSVERTRRLIYTRTQEGHCFIWQKVKEVSRARNKRYEVTLDRWHPVMFGNIYDVEYYYYYYLGKMEDTKKAFSGKKDGIKIYCMLRR